MAHTIQIKDHKQLNDGQLALLAECCGDQSTHSWLTCAASVVIDDAQFQDAIDFHCQRVANQHESMLQASSKLANLIGTAIVVTLPTPASAPPPPVPPAPQTTAVQ